MNLNHGNERSVMTGLIDGKMKNICQKPCSSAWKNNLPLFKRNTFVFFFVIFTSFHSGERLNMAKTFLHLLNKWNTVFSQRLKQSKIKALISYRLFVLFLFFFSNFTAYLWANRKEFKVCVWSYLTSSFYISSIFVCRL